MMRIGIMLFVVGLLLSTIYSTSAQILPGNRTSTETVISPTVAKTLLNEEYAHGYSDPNYITVSTRGKCIVQELTTPQGRTVSVNGMPGATFTRIPEPVHFIEGDSVCYFALTHEKLYIVHDGIARQPVDGIKLLMVAHWMPSASVRDEDSGWGPMGMLISNSGDINASGNFCEGNSSLALPGKHVIYVARRAGKQLIIFDGVEGPPYDRIGAVLFSRDGEHHAYTAKHGSTWRVVRDGIAQPAYAAIGNTYKDPEFSNVNFSLNGQHLSYLVSKKGKELIVVDGKEFSRDDPAVKLYLADVERINPPYLYPQVIHNTTSTIFINTIKSQKNYAKNVVVPPKYSTMMTVPLLESGADNTFFARKGDKELMVTDGKEGPLYDQVLQQQAIPGHPGVAYVAQKGQQFFVVRGTLIGQAYDGIVDRSLCFSDNGSRMAYRAIKGNSEVMVVDGQEGPACEKIINNSFAFNADSKHYHYAISGNKGIQLVIDGQIVNPIPRLTPWIVLRQMESGFAG